MYKDLGTIMITGGIGTGNTTFIKKYIDEIIEQGKNNIIYIVVNYFDQILILPSLAHENNLQNEFSEI